MQDITSKEAEQVAIIGEEYNYIFDPELFTESQDTDDIGKGAKRSSLEWLVQSMESVFPNLASILVYYDGKTVIKHGRFPSSLSLQSSDGEINQETFKKYIEDEGTNVEIKMILEKALQKEVDKETKLSFETYIPDLQVLPGKIDVYSFLFIYIL